MSNTNKFLRGGLAREQEDTLESVSGGIDFIRPGFDPKKTMYRCPACGCDIISNGIDGCPERVQCPVCGCWFRFDGSELVEVQP